MTVYIIAIVCLIAMIITLMIRIIGDDAREYEYMSFINKLIKENAVLKAERDILKIKQDPDYKVEIDEELERLIDDLLKEEI